MRLPQHRAVQEDDRLSRHRVVYACAVQSLSGVQQPLLIAPHQNPCGLRFGVEVTFVDGGADNGGKTVECIHASATLPVHLILMDPFLCKEEDSQASERLL